MTGGVTPLHDPHDATAAKTPGPEAQAARGGSAGGRLRDLAAWARQLLILIRSGMPLADALLAIARQTDDGRWKTVLTSLHHSLEEGSSLADAMADHPRYFSPICRGLIRAGEASGQLDTMLDRLANLTRHQLRLRRFLVSAMVYPSLLIAVAVIVVVVMLGFVLPRFEGLFQTLQVPLPPSTEVLMDLSVVLRSHWWALLLGLAAAVAAANLFRSTHAGATLIDRWSLVMPLIGKMRRNLETAKILRLLGTLLESRVDVLDALRLTGAALTSRVYASLIEQTIEAVKRGRSISSSFGACPHIAVSVSEAIHHGEQSGQTGPVMTSIAEFMDEDNEITVKTMTSVLEPLILILLGAIVAFIALSMFLPLFDLTAMT
jgi:type II secretory pathway component PulF